MSLSNLIKNFLNIQDDNISFPEEEYYQVIQKDNYLIKLFKVFLKFDYYTCCHCNSKNIIKIVLGIVKLNIFLFKTTILNLNLPYKDIFVRSLRKPFHLLLILLLITLLYLIILCMLLHLSFKKIFFLHLLLRDTTFLFFLCRELLIAI